MRTLLRTVAAVVAAAALAVWIGRVTSDRRIEGEVDDLLAAGDGGEPEIIAESDLAGLPEPVQRWLRWSRVVGNERPRTVRLEQVGTFRLGEDRKWMPFTAEQHYTTDPPGFVWAVSMTMFPLVTITGRDRYMNGVGSIDMRVQSLVPVAHQTGGGLNQGALLRYLNETMWFPGAALSPSITWEPIDVNSARATMTHGGITASATFLFDDEGRVTNMTAGRYNDDKDAILPWSTPVEDHGEFQGVRVPVKGSGVWHDDSGDVTYIRLTVTEIEYNPTDD